LQKENHDLISTATPWETIVLDFTKDMNLLGWNVNMDMFPNPQSLESFVAGVYVQNRPMLVELLYRMNISENDMGQALANIQPNEFSSLYSKKIVERSIQRIEWRKRFSD